jgi:hypothetical protein
MYHNGIYRKIGNSVEKRYLYKYSVMKSHPLNAVRLRFENRRNNVYKKLVIKKNNKRNFKTSVLLSLSQHGL